MADIAINKKAPLVVLDADGNPVTSFLATASEGAPFHFWAGGGYTFVIPDALGTGTVYVEAGGSTGELEVTVVAAPLTVSLGPAEPK